MAPILWLEHKYVHLLCGTCGVKLVTTQHQVGSHLFPRLGCVSLGDLFASRHSTSPFWMHSNASNSGGRWALSSLAEAGEGHHLPGLGNLEGTSLSQGLTACKRNKQNI